MHYLLNSFFLGDAMIPKKTLSMFINHYCVLIFPIIFACISAEEYTIYVTIFYVGPIDHSYLLMKKQNGTLIPFNTTVELAQQPPAAITEPLQDDPEQYRFIDNDMADAIITAANNPFNEMMQKIKPNKSQPYSLKETDVAWITYRVHPQSKIIEIVIVTMLDKNTLEDIKALNDLHLIDAKKLYDQTVEQVTNAIMNHITINPKKEFTKADIPSIRYDNMVIDPNYVYLYIDEKTLENSVKRYRKKGEHVAQRLKTLGTDFFGLLAVLQ